MSTVEDIKKIYDTDFECEYENEEIDTKYREEFLRRETLLKNSQMEAIRTKVKREKLKLTQNNGV